MFFFIYFGAGCVVVLLAVQVFKANVFGMPKGGAVPPWGPGPDPTFQCGSDMRWYYHSVAHQQRRLEGPREDFHPIFWSCVSPEDGGVKCYGLGDRYRGIEYVFLISITAARPFLLASTYEGDVQRVLMPREVYWNVTEVPGLEMWGVPTQRPPPAYHPDVFEYLRGDLQEEPFESTKLLSNGTTRFAWNHRADGTSHFVAWARRYWRGKASDELKEVWESIIGMPTNKRFGCLFHTLFRIAPELQESIALSLFEVCQKSGIVPRGADFENWVHRPSLRQFFASQYGNLWLPRMTMTDAIAAIFPHVRRSEVPPIVSIHFRAGGQSLSWYAEDNRTSVGLVPVYIGCGIEAVAPHKGKIIFASDSTAAKVAARELRPEEVITLDATEVPKHIYHSHDGLQGAMETYTELVVLSLGHKFIATRSGFGRISALMGFFHPDEIFVKRSRGAPPGCKGFRHISHISAAKMA